MASYVATVRVKQKGLSIGKTTIKQKGKKSKDVDRLLRVEAAAMAWAKAARTIPATHLSVADKELMEALGVQPLKRA